jgi:hypothetical protein
MQVLTISRRNVSNIAAFGLHCPPSGRSVAVLNLNRAE